MKQERAENHVRVCIPLPRASQQNLFSPWFIALTYFSPEHIGFQLLCDCRKRKLLQPVRRTVCRILKKPHTGLPYDSIISWFNICTEKATIQNMNPNIHCSTICNSQYMEASCLSTDGWRRKLWYIYTMEHYTSIKNEIGLPVVTKMNPEYVRVKKVRERNKYCILTRTGGMRKKVFHKGGTWNLEKRYGWTYSQDRITEINGERISGHSGRRRWGKLKKYHWGG